MDAMNEQQARQRLLEGGYFVALGVPPGVDFGVDLKSFKTGPQFKGVKMIPPGLHLAHFGTGEGEKQGIFFRSSAASVAATQWDPSAEDLVDAETCVPEGALRALREAVLRLEMDANLGPHPLEQHAAWTNLTNCITDSVLERCGVPVGAKVLAGSSAAEPGEPGGEALPADDAANVQATRGKRTRKEDAAAAAAHAGMEIVPHFPHVGRVARYCTVPDRTVDAADRSDPGELTRRNMDGSESLERWIASDFGGSWMDLLGQLQLSFVLFVSLSSLGGFRHWQELCALMCRCGDALKTNPPLFSAFIRILHAHLKLVPEDFFSVELSKDNFLVPCLSALLQNVLPDKSLAPPLLEAGKRLLKFLQQRFGLFLGGADSNDDEVAAAAATRRPPPPRSHRSSGGDEFVGQTRDGRIRTDLGVHAGGTRNGTVGQGWVERGSGDDAVGAGSSDTEELSLMQLELSEEDQPVVVPYEEVVRALGDGALELSSNLTNPQEEREPATPCSLSDDEQKSASARAMQEENHARRQVHEQVQELGEGEGVTSMEGEDDEESLGRSEVGSIVGVLPKPSAEHSQRWCDIDRLLMSAGAPSSKTLPVASSRITSASFKNSTSSADKHGLPGQEEAVHTSNAAASDSASDSGEVPGLVTREIATLPATLSAEATAAANKYPLLFAATRANEDVMMAAARLLNPEAEEANGSGMEVIQEAVTFLEKEIGGSEDGGAAVWQVSSSGGELGSRSSGKGATFVPRDLQERYQ